MDRRNRSAEELREASNWLLYEYWMLRGLNYMLQSCDDWIEVGLLRNAVLDSFLVHARALIDFLFGGPDPRYDADVVATDYLDQDSTDDWTQHYKEDPKWFEPARTRINKGVAHISYDRRKEAWQLDEIERGVSSAFEEFVNRVPPHLLGTRWEKIKSRIEAGNASPIVLPPFLERGGPLNTSFYPLPTSDWYPDEVDED